MAEKIRSIRASITVETNKRTVTLSREFDELDEIEELVEEAREQFEY